MMERIVTKLRSRTGGYSKRWNTHKRKVPEAKKFIRLIMQSLDGTFLEQLPGSVD